MPYVKETCIAGKTKEIRKYYTFRYGVKGEKRNAAYNRTSECQERININEAKRKLRRLLNANFKEGDYLITGDFRKEERPEDSTALQKEMEKFIDRLRYRFKKNGKELKYIYVKELGKKGACHFHMVINECPIKWLQECWKHGGIHVDPLFTEEYSAIANYFVKYSQKTIETEGALIGKRYYASRNLKKPVVIKKVMRANRFRKDIKVEKGYRLLEDSVFYGVSDKTGYEMMSYTMIKDGG